MRRRTLVISLAAAAVVLVAAYGWQHEIASAPESKPQSETARVASPQQGIGTASLAQSAASGGVSRPTGVRNAQWDAAHTLPPGPVREYLPGLLAAANAPNATGAANWLAFYALHLCEFENVVAPRMRAQRTAREQAGEKDLPPAIPPAADCVGVTAKDWADKARYLKRAAEMGDDKAVTAYASGILWMNKDTEDQLRDAYSNPQAIIEWQQDSKRLLIGAAASGSTNAMFALSDAYETGRLGETNLALAYQYALITSMVSASPIFETHASRLATQLTPDQVASAQVGARAFVAQCCKPK